MKNNNLLFSTYFFKICLATLLVCLSFSIINAQLPAKFQEETVTLKGTKWDLFMVGGTSNDEIIQSNSTSGNEWFIQESDENNWYYLYHVQSDRYLSITGNVSNFDIVLLPTTTAAVKLKFNALGLEVFRLETKTDGVFLATHPTSGNSGQEISIDNGGTHRNFKIALAPFGEEVSFSGGIDASKQRLLGKSWYIHDQDHLSLLTKTSGNNLGQKINLDYGRNSQFIIEDTDNALWFFIRHRGTDQYLTVDNTTKGSKVKLMDFIDDEDDHSQHFRSITTGQVQWHKIRSRASTTGNTLNLEVKPNGDLVVEGPKTDPSPSQKFAFNQSLPNNSAERYSIVGANKGHYISDLGYQIEGQEVVHNVDNDYSCMWNFESAGSDYFYIRNILTRNYITTYGSSSKGVQMKMTASPNDFAKWELEKDDAAKFRIKNKATGHYLSTKGDNKDGDPVYQAGANSSGVKWYIIPAGEEDIEMKAGGFKDLQEHVPFSTNSFFKIYRPLLVSIGLPNNSVYRPAIWNAVVWYYQSIADAERALRNFNMTNKGHRAEMALIVRQYITNYLPSIPRSEWCPGEEAMVSWIEDKVKEIRVDFAQRKVDAWEDFEQISGGATFSNLLYQNNLDDFEAPLSYLLDEDQKESLLDYGQMARQKNLQENAIIKAGSVLAGGVAIGIINGLILNGVISSVAGASGNLFSVFPKVIAKIVSSLISKGLLSSSFSVAAVAGPATVVTAAAMVLAMQVMDVIDYEEFKGKIYTAFSKASNEVIDLHALYNGNYILGQVNLGTDLDYIFGTFSLNGTINQGISSPDGTNFLPVVDCPSNLEYELNNNNSCGVIIPTTLAISSCFHFANQFPNYAMGSFSSFQGIGEKTLKYYSPLGHLVCSQNIKVKDKIAPEVKSCPSSISTVPFSNNSCTVPVYWGEPSFKDCQPLTISSNFKSADVFPVGTTVVKYTATDPSGNTSECIFNVTIKDQVKPNASCKVNYSITLDEYGNSGNIFPEDINANSSDNCSDITLQITPNPLFENGLDCSNINNPKVYTLVVTDEGGLQSACTTAITAVDNIAPYAVCANKTVFLDNTGQGSLNAIDVGNGSYSLNDCETISFSLDKYNFDCNDIGANTVTLSAFDDSGNTATCTATISVVDNHDPTVYCKSATIELNASGNAVLAPTKVYSSASDNCAIQTLTVTPNFFDCSDIGTQNVTLTATDYDGNSDDCNAFVTIKDKINPNAQCKNHMVYLDNNGNGTLTADDIDDNSSDNCGISNRIINLTSFDCTSIGVHEVTLTITDTNGNTSSCTTDVTVEDSIQPEAKCKDFTTTCSGGQVTINPADIDNGSSDNCGVSLSLDQTVLSCVNASVTVTLTATDSAGNKDNCTALLTIQSVTGGTSVSINDVSKMEGNWWGLTYYQFEVERTGGTGAITVDYATSDGTALLSNNDYIANSGTLTWGSGGSNFKYITIAVRKDNTFESDELFYINLSNPTGGATISDGQGIAEILNDDAALLIGNHANDDSSLDELNHSELQLAHNRPAIFPNPTRDKLHITLPSHWIENGVVQMEIYNQSGEKISQFKFEESQQHLNVSELRNGIYHMMFFQKDGHVISDRFVKMD